MQSTWLLKCRSTNGWARSRLRRFFSPRSVTSRISWLSWTVALFSLLAFVAASIPEQKREIEENLRSKARGIAASLQEGLAAAAVTEDYSGVVEQCSQALMGDDTIDFLVIAKNDGFAVVVERSGWRVTHLGEIWRSKERTPSGGIEVTPLSGKRVFHFATPYDFSSLSWGWIHVGLSLAGYDRGVARLYQRTCGMAVVCVAGSLLVSVIFARRLVRPILRLQRVVGRIADGDLSARASIRSVQEIERLAQSFNTMADSLLQRDEILESVRFAAQRFLSAAGWQTVIGEVLAKIGSAAQVSRVFLLENRAAQPDGPAGTVLHEWMRPDLRCLNSGVRQPERRWTGGDWELWAPALKNGELVTINACAPDQFPLSSILVPVEVDGRWSGVLGFDDCARARVWSDAERDSFRSAAGMLGAAITRQKAQEYVDNILRSMSESLLVLDPGLRIRRVNPSALRLLRYSDEELIDHAVGMVVEGEMPASSTAVEESLPHERGCGDSGTVLLGRTAHRLGISRRIRMSGAGVDRA